MYPRYSETLLKERLNEFRICAGWDEFAHAKPPRR